MGEEEEEEDDEDEEGEDEEEEEEGGAESLFDALAAAQEAGERYREAERSQINENCRLPDDFLVTAFRSAISLSWKKSVAPVETKTVPSHNWHVGEKVMAVFYEDGLEYRAKILQIKDWKDAAVVKFTEYGNEEEVNFSELSKMNKKPSKREQWYLET